MKFVIVVVSVACVLTPAFLAQPPQRSFTLEPVRVQKKLALVIGNSSYPKSPLKNPGNDARAVAQALRGFAFDEVIEKRDLTYRQMRDEINDFSAKLQRGDLALFYYAGHGVQADEKNYLIPVDWDSKAEADLPYEAYQAAQARDKLEKSGARLRILILDACRSNPFHPSSRDEVRGLSPMGSAVEGTFIAYATADNSVADDNKDESNGLFTKLLLSALGTPGLDLRQIFDRTRQDVYLASQKKQLPFIYDGVIGQFFFTPPKAPSPPAPSAETERLEEIAYWNGIDKSDADLLQMYLNRYPNGRFAEIARRSLTKLSPAAPPSAPPGTPPTPTFPKPGTIQVMKDGLPYVWIPPGSFEMGCSAGDSECDDDEKPSHRVTIGKGFWIGQSAVTQQAWERVMGKRPSRFKGPKLPVENVGWNDAKSYCEKVDLRLPTEAEWEYAARGQAGSSPNRYGKLDEIAWYFANSQGKTHEIASRRQNGFGLFDMLGNVWQWVEDWYDAYSPGAATDPKGPATGTLRVLRGGSWSSDSGLARVSYRSRSEPESHYGNSGNFGVRCAGN